MQLADYSVYLPDGPITEPWGVCVTGAGHTRIPPNVAYPPGRHPDDHALSWERGRVLQAYQIVYITEGGGRFESSATGRRKITAGSAFLLFPGVWHRYEPGRATGWAEDWVELRGPAVDRLERAGVISPKSPVIRLGLRPELLELFVQCHQLARSMPRGYQPVLGVLGLQILARVVNDTPTAGADALATDEGVRRAQVLIGDAADRPLRMEEVAEDVGMSYSHFRRAFRARTGLSPKQYHLQLRLRKAQELLADSAMSVKEIADALAYDSPFHLSADFKARTGLSPRQWRAQCTVRGAKTRRAAAK